MKVARDPDERNRVRFNKTELGVFSNDLQEIMEAGGVPIEQVKFKPMFKQYTKVLERLREEWALKDEWKLKGGRSIVPP